MGINHTFKKNVTPIYLHKQAAGQKADVHQY